MKGNDEFPAQAIGSAMREGGLSQEEAIDHLHEHRLKLHISGASGAELRAIHQADIDAGTAPGWVERAMAWYHGEYSARWRKAGSGGTIERSSAITRKLRQEEREGVHTKLDILGEAMCPNCGAVLNWVEMPVMLRGVNRRAFSVSFADCGLKASC